MRRRDGKDAALELLVTSAAGGDEEAWRELWNRLEPRLGALIRRGLAGARTGRDDDCRDVVVAVMARLRKDDFHRLQVYLAARALDPGLTFMRWLIVLARNVAVDCLRAHPDYVDVRRSAAADEPPGRWVKTETLDDDAPLGRRPPLTNRVTAQQILRYAAGVLNERQRRALEIWTANGSNDDIARDLGLASAADAARLVHAALERLRRHFR